MKISPEEVVELLSDPKLDGLLSARGNAVVDTILDALYEQIERREEEKESVNAKESESPRYLPARTCPECHNDSYIISTRERNDGTILRRRECQSCGHRFSTMEIYYNYRKHSTSEV